MAERRPRYRPDRDRAAPGDPGKCRKPPLAQAHGAESLSVPLWEKKFCTDACAIPWGKLHAAKQVMPLFKDIVDWDDSAAFEAYKDAKARFFAVYHGQPCDIPLPDPNMYIDTVNPDEHIDPELVTDLDKSPCAVPKMDNAAPDGWDSFIYTDKPVPITGWGDWETGNTSGQQWSVNWDTHVERPIEVLNCKQTSVSSNYFANQPAQTNVQQSSGNWDMYVEQEGQTNSWGAPIMPCTSNGDINGDSLHAWNQDDCGAAATQTNSLGNHGDRYYVSDRQGGSYEHRRRNNRPGKRNGRNRDRGGPISSNAMKSKYQSNEHSGANNGWGHCRVRDSMHYS